MAWKVPTLARVANGWSMNTDTMGVYGNYYLKRAIVAQLGLGANLPEDAIYPLNLADETGKPLDGANKYTIHFDKGAPPPVNAFWSITLYDQEGFQVANSLNRFAVSSWMPFDVQPGRLARPLFPEREPGRGQGGELAARAEGAVQPDHAPLRPEERGADRQMEPAAGRRRSRGRRSCRPSEREHRGTKKRTSVMPDRDGQDALATGVGWAFVSRTPSRSTPVSTSPRSSPEGKSVLLDKQERQPDAPQP